MKPQLRDKFFFYFGSYYLYNLILSNSANQHFNQPKYYNEVTHNNARLIQTVFVNAYGDFQSSCQIENNAS